MKPDSSEIDPESAALLRQLHRELNGLPSRRSKTKAAAAAAEPDAQHKRRRTGDKRSDGRAGRSGNPSTTVSEAGSARTSYEKDSSRVQPAASGQQQRQAGRSKSRGDPLESSVKHHTGSSSGACVPFVAFTAVER